ncbi:hypothetical protein CCAL6883_03780 [Campylobacter sp. RM6883]|uniref:hypothetical protein n=1 Tax=Campylobacter californiensis TaxID=1032243 RepID=UPI001451FD60|nr:hypothetical protein [Campylobacter sp. RM6914]MBE2984470.1 hypothetical protein [Campylobacter sp. RM6883]MBE2995000.1 hypothetical protein [Campylobacter sp. RM6913]QCD50187.1 hypothetical protein CCAL_0264 [Campylobacter sp. RM6914]
MKIPTNDDIKNIMLQNLSKNANALNLSDMKSNEYGSFLENLAQNEKGNSTVYKELEKEVAQDAKMFKQFDFMRLMNRLQFGNLNDKERAEIFAKMTKIASEI